MSQIKNIPRALDNVHLNKSMFGLWSLLFLARKLIPQ